MKVPLLLVVATAVTVKVVSLLFPSPCTCLLQVMLSASSFWLTLLSPTGLRLSTSSVPSPCPLHVNETLSPNKATLERGYCNTEGERRVKNILYNQHHSNLQKMLQKWSKQRAKQPQLERTFGSQDPSWLKVNLLQLNCWVANFYSIEGRGS